MIYINYDEPESPPCYLQSFVEIGQPVLEKTIFKVCTIYGHGGHVGHVTWTIHINFDSPFLKMLNMKVSGNTIMITKTSPSNIQIFFFYCKN